MLTRRQITSFAHLTIEQLDAWWRAIDLDPAHRVRNGRNKGMLKLSALRLSDQILAEIARRRALHHIDAWERSGRMK